MATTLQVTVNVWTVKSITDLMLNGIALKVVNCHVANDTGTGKINLAAKGLPTKTGIPVAGTPDHSFVMVASGQGTLPLVGDTITVTTS